MKIELENPVTANNLDQFAHAYIECMLWSSSDDNDASLDENYNLTDIAPDTMARILADCASFYYANNYYLQVAIKRDDFSYKQAGHDLWLTRCGHGTGFWDRNLSNSVGDILTKASENFCHLDAYVGNDNLIYIV